MIDRRHFLRGLGALGVLPITGIPDIAAAAETQSPQARVSPDDPNFWSSLRQQFLIPPDEAYFNAGTLGACPKPVMDAVAATMNDVEKTIAQYDYKPEHPEYIAGYRPQPELRRKAGELMNAKGEETALVQNATMAYNFIVHGLELKAGDEALITDQEHVGAQGPWDLRAKRHGVVVKQIKLPIPTPDPESVVKSFAAAITPKTKVIAVPHITSRYGIVLPVKELCALARERGIFSLVDGAQAIGQLRVDVKAIGCDAYATSPHKWLLSPPGTGLLYLRAEKDQEIWTTLASREWNNHTPADGIFRLMQFGTLNLAIFRGLDAAIDFYQGIGPERVEKRIMGMADQLRAGLQKIKGAKIYSPVHPAMKCAMVTYGLDGKTGTEVMDQLWEKKKIRVRAQGSDAVRQSVHIYNSPGEIEATLEMLKTLA
jgi:selenocysteine lyase/cysteine desulfurase